MTKNDEFMFMFMFILNISFGQSFQILLLNYLMFLNKNFHSLSSIYDFNGWISLLFDFINFPLFYALNHIQMWGFVIRMNIINNILYSLLYLWLEMVFGIHGSDIIHIHSL